MADVTADYLALRRNVAAVRLPRQVIRVFGADAVRFLDGQLSQDVAALHPGEHAWSLLLEPQGKVIAWLRLWGRHGGDEVLMDVAAGAGQAVLDRLNRFRLRVDAELELLDWECVALRGPGSSAVEVRAELRADVDWAGLSGRRPARPRGPPARGAPPRRARRPTRPCASRPAGQRRAARSPGSPSRASSPPRSAAGSSTPPPASPRGATPARNSWPGSTRVATTRRGACVGSSSARTCCRRSARWSWPRSATAGRSPAWASRSTSERRSPSAFVHRSVEPGAEVTLRWEGLDGEPVEAAAHVRELPLVGTTVE